MRRRLVVLAAPLALAAVAAAPSFAASKPAPIKKTYTATAATPDPASNNLNDVCDNVLPGSVFTQAFKAPAAGTLVVELTKFTGDWDLAVRSGGKELGTSAEAQPVVSPQVEKVSIKLKKAAAVDLLTCNYLGGSTGSVTYTFTYA